MLRLLAGEAARRFGPRAAVVSGPTALSFVDLDRLSDQVAAGFSHRGIRIGDLIALALPDGPEFVVCYVAAAKIGAVTAGIGARRSELLAELDPALVVTAPGVLPPLPGLDVVTLPLAYGSRQPYDNLSLLARQEPPPPPFPPDPSRPVVITFTAGRTGPPKGVLFGNRQLEAIRAHGAGQRWGTGDARLVSQPMGHLSFVTRLPVFLQTGRTSFILRDWEADTAARVLRLHGLGVLQGSPHQLSRILAGGAELPDLSLILLSGGPAPPALTRALREKYGVPVCNRYICTEAGLGLGTRPDDPPEDAEFTVGSPRAGVDLSIRNGEGSQLPREVEGEVLLRSHAVMSGYTGKYRGPRVFARDGFVRTGDRGYIDHVGRLHLVGRVSPETQSRSQHP